RRWWGNAGRIVVSSGGVARVAGLPARGRPPISSARRVSRLAPPSPAAGGFTRRDRPHNDPHESAGPPGRRQSLVASRRPPPGADLGGAGSVGMRGCAPDASDAAVSRPGLAGAGGLAGGVRAAPGWGRGAAPPG